MLSIWAKLFFHYISGKNRHPLSYHPFRFFKFHFEFLQVDLKVQDAVVVEVEEEGEVEAGEEVEVFVVAEVHIRIH